MKTLPELVVIVITALTLITGVASAADSPPSIEVTSLEVAHADSDTVTLDVHLNRQKFVLENIQIGFLADRNAPLNKDDFHPLSDFPDAKIERDGRALTIALPWLSDDMGEVAIQYGDNGRVLATELPKTVSAQNHRASAAASVCHPQCTDKVYEITHINFTKCWGKLYGDAGQWYDHAKACKFSTEKEKPKDKSILEISSPGHVIYVRESKRLGGGKYSLQYTDANWDLNCGVRNSTATYDRDRRQISFGGRWYLINGFITKW